MWCDFNSVTSDLNRGEWSLPTFYVINSILKMNSKNNRHQIFNKKSKNCSLFAFNTYSAASLNLKILLSCSGIFQSFNNLFITFKHTIAALIVTPFRYCVIKTKNWVSMLHLAVQKPIQEKINGYYLPSAVAISNGDFSSSSFAFTFAPFLINISTNYLLLQIQMNKCKLFSAISGSSSFTRINSPMQCSASSA